MVVNPQSSVTRFESRAALEDIGHLARRICGIWGTPELDTFLSGLLMDARGGSRQGLPVAVAAEILFLAQTNKMRRALELSEKLSLHVEETYRMVDEGDQRRLRVDALDDPLVSRDTVTRANQAAEPAARRPAPPAAGSQAPGLGALLWRLIRSEWVLWAIGLFLCIRYVWPIVKPMI